MIELVWFVCFCFFFLRNRDSFIADFHKNQNEAVVLTQIDENGNLNSDSDSDKCDSHS